MSDVADAPNTIACLSGQAHPFRGAIDLPESRFVASRYLCVFDIEQSEADPP